MKTSLAAARAAAAALLCTFFPGALMAQGNGNGNSKQPQEPRGWLTAFPQMAQVGTRPTLTWGITYPSVVQDYVKITSPSTICAKEELDVEIRVLGAGVTAHSSGSSNFTFVPTEAQVSFNGGSYQPIFYGSNLSVKPNKVVYTLKKIKAGECLRFGGRYYYNRQWGSYYNSQSGTQNVRALVHGDTPPTTNPMHLTPTLEEFIKPYLDANGRVNIGPMDVIVFMELTHSDSQIEDQGYDLQDMVLLVTFTSKRAQNNGHGNNVDGVDSSNPGNAPFEDSDPTVDDEGGGGGAAPSNP